VKLQARLREVLFVVFAGAFGSVALAQPVPLAQGPDGLQVTSQDVLDDVNLRVPENVRATALGDPAIVAQVATAVAMRRTLAAAAEAHGLDKDPRVAKRLRFVREQVLAEERLAQVAGPGPDAAALEQLAQSEYRAKADKYTTPEKVRVRDIVVDARSCDAEKRAAELLAKAKAPGADFAALAKDNSQDYASAKRGGDLGLVARGQLPPQLDKAAFALQKPGDVSDVVRTDTAFHILRLEERVPAVREPFEKVRDALVKELGPRLDKERRTQAAEPIEAKLTLDREAIAEFAKQHR
jgi:peptidyl-prolyl cis-trans isomerase C